MSQVTEYQGGGLPVRAGRASGNSALTAGVGASFNVLSIQGKTFRIKQGKEETKLLDKRGNPIPELNVVIVDASPHVSRTYYAGGFSSAGGPPTCSSSDGVRPDGFVQSPQAKSCAGCPRSVRDQVTPSGAKVSACSNNRRIAIVPESDLANESLGGPMLLRVPGGSLIGLSNYAHSLDRKNYDFWQVVTTLQFDPAVAHPKLIFHPERVLHDDEQIVVDDLRRSDVTRNVLALSESAEAAPAPAAAQAGGFDALPTRAEKRPDPRDVTSTSQVSNRVAENITQMSHQVEDRVEARVTQQVTPEPQPKRTRAKATIAGAVSEPVVVEPTAAGFEANLNARLKNLI